MDGEAAQQNQTNPDEAKPERKSSEGILEEDEESDGPDLSSSLLDKKQLLIKMLEKQSGGAK